MANAGKVGAGLVRLLDNQFIMGMELLYYIELEWLIKIV